jgi:hypothetical protein
LRTTFYDQINQSDSPYVQLLKRVLGHQPLLCEKDLLTYGVSSKSEPKQGTEMDTIYMHTLLYRKATTPDAQQ